MNLSPYIRELITLNECIILPNFGGFETSYLPAEFNTDTQQMLPPSKSISFKPEYSKGGEILEQYLIKKLSISKKEARQFVTDYVSEIKSRLNSNKDFRIEEVGYFSLNARNQIEFTPFSEENYLADSFGLEPLHYEAGEPDPTFQNSIKNKVLTIQTRNNTLSFVIIGIIVISILLALTVFISARFDLYLFNIGDDYKGNDKIILGSNYPSDSTHAKLEQKIDETTSVRSALQFNQPDQTSEELPATYYILVAGSFKGYNNALELHKKLTNDGFSTNIVEAGGYYRVSIGQFDIKKNALNELQRIRNQIDRSIWLLTISET